MKPTEIVERYPLLRERIARRCFTIECRRTGIQPLPGATWSGDAAQRSLARLRALRRFRNHDLQLIEVPCRKEMF